MTGPDAVVFFRMQGDRGTRVMTIAPTIGGLRIGCQDLAASVAAFGPDLREFEWEWQDRGRGRRPAMRLLDGAPNEDDDSFPLLARWAARGQIERLPNVR